MNTHNKSINWVVVVEGRIVSMHRDGDTAERRADKTGGIRLAADSAAPALRVGSRVRSFAGAAIPA